MFDLEYSRCGVGLGMVSETMICIVINFDDSSNNSPGIVARSKSLPINLIPGAKSYKQAYKVLEDENGNLVERRVVEYDMGNGTSRVRENFSNLY